ncbi:MAG: CHRD domain-containing protein [Chthoniobacterales bacterium]
MKSKFPLLTIVASALISLSPAARAQTYFANLNGANEAPPNASAGTGFAQITINLQTHVLVVHADFSNLTASATAAHVHAATATPFSGTAGVATQTPTFSGFPTATSGTYDMSFDMMLASTWNASYISANGGTPGGAEAAFAQALSEGRAYFNIHTSAFPGGEIRGFLAVPEPATTALLVLGSIGTLCAARRARRA